MLCPKKGGAMKPTNIFTSFENYKLYNSNASGGTGKKAPGGKKHHHHFNSSISEQINDAEGLIGLDNKPLVRIGENEDKNLSLTVILNREFNYQSDIRLKFEKQELPSDSLDLHFDANEKETQTPDDYSLFIQRNEPRLDSH